MSGDATPSGSGRAGREKSGPSPDRIALAEITQFLAQWQVAGLATLDDEGAPYPSNVVYASDRDGHLFFASAADSAHAGHLVRDGRVALTVYAAGNVVAGVQATGRCREIPRGTDAHRAGVEFYLDMLEGHHDASPRRDRLERESLYCARLDWAKLLNAARGEAVIEWRREGGA